MIKPKQSNENLVCKCGLKNQNFFRRKSKFYFSNGNIKYFQWWFGFKRTKFSVFTSNRKMIIIKLCYYSPIVNSFLKKVSSDDKMRPNRKTTKANIRWIFITRISQITKI